MTDGAGIEKFPHRHGVANMASSVSLVIQMPIRMTRPTLEILSGHSGLASFISRAIAPGLAGCPSGNPVHRKMRVIIQFPLRLLSDRARCW